jgi:DNA-binding IscR family transcriptional regulator
MYDKTLLKKAVKNFSGYSEKFCEVFDILLDLSVNNELVVKSQFIIQNYNIKKSTLYFAIQRFKKDNLLDKEKGKSGKIIFNADKLDYYLSFIKNLEAQNKK